MRIRAQSNLRLGGGALALLMLIAGSASGQPAKQAEPQDGVREAAEERVQSEAPAGAQAGDHRRKFFPDDPMKADLDNLPIEKPGEVELSGIYDVIEHSFGYKPGENIPRAVNVNTLGEVPDSSWFTNRIGLFRAKLL